MEPVILHHLEGRDLTVRLDSAADLRAEPGSEFKIRVTVANSSGKTVHWSADHPLHLAYRCLKADGEVIEPDGRRTIVPGPLLPHSSADVQLVAVAPEHTGDYELVVSLVLEGVQWACDVAPDTSSRVALTVVPPTAWPAELEQSIGGRALRGAIAAARLQRELQGATGPQAAAPRESDASSVAAVPVTIGLEAPIFAEPKRRKVLRVRFRNWLRRVLGVTDVQGMVEEASRQLGGEVRDLRAVVDHLVSTAEAQQRLAEDVTTASRTLIEDAARKDSTLRNQDDAIGRLQEAVAGLQQDLTLTTEGVSKELPALKQDLIDVAAQTEAGLRRLLTQLAELDDGMRGLLEDKGSVDKRIAQLVESDRGLVRELKGGPAVIELISSIRGMAARLAEDPTLEKIETHRRDFVDWKKLAEENWTYQFSKLDSLLRRQAIPLAGSGLVLLRNRFGLLAVQDDDTSAVGYYSAGDVPEPATVVLVENLLQCGDIFVDVGANVGIYSLIAGRRVGPAGKVIAFEPMPSTSEALRVTIAVNGISRLVEAHEYALGSEEGSATLFIAPTSGHNSLLPSEDASVRTQPVRIRRGDRILGRQQPRLIKIDVEGWELDVIDGLAETLDRSRGSNLVVEYSAEHIQRRGLTRSDWFSRIKAVRKKVWRLKDDEVSLIPVSRDQELPDAGCNLFLADELPPILEFMLK